jgi:hypothetical protein
MVNGEGVFSHGKQEDGEEEADGNEEKEEVRPTVSDL